LKQGCDVNVLFNFIALIEKQKQRFMYSKNEVLSEAYYRSI